MIREFPPIVDGWFLAGATATGKTAISLALAETLNAEIVSMDSMAVYRAMNVGTAKPSEADRSRVPHHVIDVVEPNEEYSLAQYLADAHAAVASIQSRSRNVLFVGGTPLYLISLIRGACEGPPSNPEFRQQVEEELERVGAAALHERLRQVDPLSAAKLHPNDKRRMIRALEVYTLTGQPISHLQTQFEGKYSDRCKNVFVLSRDRGALHKRIDDRTDKLFESGFVAEVESLLARYGALSRTALQGVGYQEVLQHLQEQWPIESAIEETKIRTRRYARRQETWFRRLDECRRVSLDEDPPIEQILDCICCGNASNDAG